MMKHKKRTV